MASGLRIGRGRGVISWKTLGSHHRKEGHIRGKVLSRLAPHTKAIVRQYGAGASFEELAEQFGGSWQTVRRFLLANEVSLRPSQRRKLDPVEAEVTKAFARGGAAPQIAGRYGVKTQTVLNFLAARDLREVRRRAGKARTNALAPNCVEYPLGA